MADGLDPRHGARVLAIANQKGGVGKTTTAINLGTALAARGHRVLIVEIDPQGNASTGLGVDRNSRVPNIYHVLVNEEAVGPAIVNTLVPGMDLVPASSDLSGAEVELVPAWRREYRLADALQNLPSGYDYVLIDCPPALGLLTLNALVAADAVLVPLQTEFYALEGLSLLLRTVDRVRRALNPKLQIQGIVLTMYDTRNNLSRQVADDVREHLGDKVYETVIPRNVRVSEAPSYGRPVLLYDMQCPGSQAYIGLARELIAREKTLRATAAPAV